MLRVAKSHADFTGFVKFSRNTGDFDFRVIFITDFFVFVFRGRMVLINHWLIKFQSTISLIFKHSFSSLYYYHHPRYPSLTLSSPAFISSIQLFPFNHFNPFITSILILASFIPLFFVSVISPITNN